MCGNKIRRKTRRHVAVMALLCVGPLAAALPGCATHKPGRHGSLLATQPAPGRPTVSASQTQASQAPASQALPDEVQAAAVQAAASQERIVLPLDRLPTTQPTTQPIYDLTLPKPVPPRDFLERWAQQRGPDLSLVDKLMDKRTELPPFDRQAPSPLPADARIAPDVPLLSETNPFPEPIPLPAMEASLRAGIARSTFRTRTWPEVYSAADPFLDIVKRDVNLQAEDVLYEQPQEMYFDLMDGKTQLAIAHVFDALLIRGWVANAPDNRVILALWAQPANPYTTSLDVDAPGPPGTGIVLLVARDAPYKTFADLKGTRLALPANYINAPGAFLTRLLRDAGQPAEQAFFGSVSLRLYSKDAAIDILKDKADVACVDEGTLGALVNIYGLVKEYRVLAVSPHYNIDVVFTTANNVATHRTQIELAERMLLTQGRDPEGQEVLFFFDTASWNIARQGDLSVATDHFADFLQFFQHTPVDLKPLLDPHAPIDRKTYTRYGDE